MKRFEVIQQLRNSLSHSGVKGQRWGVRNGPPYPLDSDAWANKIAVEARKREPKITKDIQDAANKTSGKLYGTEHKLKTLASIKRKIETDAEEKGITVSKAARDLKDACRYTLLSKNREFVSDYETFKTEMLANGYKETRCRNYFEDYRAGKVKHKSVQSVFETSDGYRFEVQFHTPASQEAKDRKLPLYEERRRPGLSEATKAELERKMEDLARDVPDPPDISRIKSH